MEKWLRGQRVKHGIDKCIRGQRRQRRNREMSKGSESEVMEIEKYIRGLR
jgi:hypothetical protein